MSLCSCFMSPCSWYVFLAVIFCREAQGAPRPCASSDPFSNLSMTVHCLNSGQRAERLSQKLEHVAFR